MGWTVDAPPSRPAPPLATRLRAWRFLLEQEDPGDTPHIELLELAADQLDGWHQLWGLLVVSALGHMTGAANLDVWVTGLAEGDIHG